MPPITPVPIAMASWRHHQKEDRSSFIGALTVMAAPRPPAQPSSNAAPRDPALIITSFPVRCAFSPSR
jgi:hypothetical protein